MDVTALARTLLEPVPAHRTVGIQVVRAADGEAEITAEVPESLTNVIGSLHSSGLVALLDAAGLGAIIAASETPGDFDGVVPLGTSATLEFLAPARGRLRAVCHLAPEAYAALGPLLSAKTDRVRFSTHAEITDTTGDVVCRGTFNWSVRRSRA
ncbi:MULTISPECIES: DUF4442 domain-containing protein [unclassified Streptomyces]|uniref:PaaI family thioesterase n=1 Tax=unclassified Streptomyces TaxID=2593676 RepID=UPI002E2A97CB|nr:DUF4442 domain-containing protein [Streptomyces sp. NBC_00228]